MAPEPATTLGPLTEEMLAAMTVTSERQLRNQIMAAIRIRAEEESPKVEGDSLPMVFQSIILYFENS